MVLIGASKCSVAAVGALLLVAACGEELASDAPRSWRVIAPRGDRTARLVTPRGLSLGGEHLWVVDRSGFVRRFSTGGELERSFEIQEGRAGFPIGILACENGGFLLCDTHSSRLRSFDAEGAELRRMGRFGQGPGEFHYPQRVVRDGRGRLYVSEYGEGASNRVQVFDGEGRFLLAFGGYGFEPGRFTRAMGLAILGDEIFVGDASDRILVFSLEGEFRREFGASGRAAGELKYPHGLCAVGETLYVCEYGNHRVQRFDRSGASRGFFGGPGAGKGRFQGPWDISGDERGWLYVCDAGNHRVVAFHCDEVPWQGAEK